MDAKNYPWFEEKKRGINLPKLLMTMKALRKNFDEAS
jgi:hypothetical protein